MKSLDTSILYYATNASCPEHESARALIDAVALDSRGWILADQVLFEYYRLVRNPTVLARPLGAPEAAKRLAYFRRELGCQHCG